MNKRAHSIELLNFYVQFKEKYQDVKEVISRLKQNDIRWETNTYSIPLH